MAELDVDTFLTIVYCVIDDVYSAECAPHKPQRPGRKPEVSDSEVLTLAILAQWQQNRSESAFLRYARTHWRSYFPRMLSQSAFNRRVRDLAGVLAWVGPAVGRMTVERMAQPPAFAAMDTVPVPVMRRCRGDAHRCFGAEAQVGRGGSDKAWYYGVQLLVVVSAGVITGFVFGAANTEARWLAEALLRWRHDPAAGVPRAEEVAPVLGPTHTAGGQRVGPTGPICSWLGVGQPEDGPYLGDLGFAGRAWGAHWRAQYGATVLTKAAYAPLEPPAQRQAQQRWLSRLRQIVEIANAALTEVFGLQFPRARSLWGLLTRLAAKVAAFNLARYANHLAHRNPFHFFNPLAA